MRFCSICLAEVHQSQHSGDQGGNLQNSTAILQPWQWIPESLQWRIASRPDWLHVCEFGIGRGQQLRSPKVGKVSFNATSVSVLMFIIFLWVSCISTHIHINMYKNDDMDVGFLYFYSICA